MTELFFDERTDPQVREWLQTLDSRFRQRCRLFYGDTDDGRCWLEEFRPLIQGYIRHSIGPKQVPILLVNHNSTGGMAVLDHCIIRIDVQNDSRRYRTVYQHPKFFVPAMRVTASDMFPEYVENVVLESDLSVQARFRKPGQAARYIAFMKGERHSK